MSNHQTPEHSLIGSVCAWSKDESGSFDMYHNFRFAKSAEYLGGKRQYILQKSEYQTFLILDHELHRFADGMFKVLMATGEVGWICATADGEIEVRQ